jgi:hypothetical protein
MTHGRICKNALPFFPTKPTVLLLTLSASSSPRLACSVAQPRLACSVAGPATTLALARALTRAAAPRYSPRSFPAPSSGPLPRASIHSPDINIEYFSCDSDGSATRRTPAVQQQQIEVSRTTASLRSSGA